MANPYLGYESLHVPTQNTDHYGDNVGGWYSKTHWHVAGILIAALVVITAMQLAGFRAMVGVGRG